MKRRKIRIEIEDRSEIDCLYAVLSLGLCTAIENKHLSTEAAEEYLFNLHTLGLLQQVRASPVAVELADRALFLDDVQRVVPKALPDSLNGLKSLALSILQSLPSSSEQKEDWLHFTKKTRPKNALKSALHSLLGDLDKAYADFEEVTSEEVRKQISEAVHQSFLLSIPDYTLPQEFGMSSAEGNRRIHDALSDFLTRSKMSEKRSELQTPEQRLEAFQDPSVNSVEGTTFDFYFSYRADL